MRTVIGDTEEQMVGMTRGLGSPTLAEAMFERVEAGITVEWIMPADIFDYFTIEYGELAADSIAGENTAVFVTDEIPIDLAIYDDTLVVIGFDGDRGVLGVVAITDDRAAVEWARDLVDDCRRQAEQIA